MKITDITIQDLEKAIQSLKLETKDGEAFNAGMYYARDLIEPCYNKLLKENERLNNIIDELKEELEISQNLNICVGCENNTDYKLKCEQANILLKELNIKLKDILKIGIDIKEISDIQEILGGDE